MSDSWLAAPVTTAAYGWRLERADGVTLGFTSHDRDVERDGLILRASPGMTPSVISESLGVAHDGLDIKAALSADSISSDDLMAGRWDGARLEIFLFDWSGSGAGTRPLACGELGAVSLSSEGFAAELLGPTRSLDKAVVPSTSPDCRAQFCDRNCGLSRARFTHRLRVTVDGHIVICEDVWPVAPENFVHGTLRWLEGKNCGLSVDIIAVFDASLELARSPHFPADEPVRVELVEGCDRRLETCASRFDNVLNFRGEPYLPGNDILTRYPGS